MEKFNSDKSGSQTDSDQGPLSSVLGWAKRNFLNLPDGCISPKRKTGGMLLPIAAIFLVFVLVRAFNISSPESAVSEPISLIEQTAVDVYHADSVEKFKWYVPEMYPNKLTDLK